MHRTADRLDRALRGAVVERAELRWPSVPDVDLSGSRTLEVVARGKHLLHRFDTGEHAAHPPADGGSVAGRAPGAAHRAGAAPARPAGRGAHRPLVGVRPAARHGRPRPHRPRVRPRRPPRARRAGPRLGCRGGGGAGHGIRGVRRRRAARPAGAVRGGHLLGQRDPVPRAGAALDPGGRPRPRAGCAAPRPAAPAHGHRPPHRLAGQHAASSAAGRGGLRARALGAAVPAVRRHRARGDDRRAAAPAHDVLVPDLPGRPGAHRRRQAAATAGQQAAGVPRAR